MSFSVAANAAGSTRNGTLTIASQTFTCHKAPRRAAIHFTGKSVRGCRRRQRLNERNGARRVRVDGKHVDGMAGRHQWRKRHRNGSVTFTAAANSTAQARTGTINVAGQPFTVTQAGAACDVTLAPTSRTVAAAGGASSTSVNATNGCAWTATATPAG